LRSTDQILAAYADLTSKNSLF